MHTGQVMSVPSHVTEGKLTIPTFMMGGMSVINFLLKWFGFPASRVIRLWHVPSHIITLPIRCRIFAVLLRQYSFVCISWARLGLINLFLYFIMVKKKKNILKGFTFPKRFRVKFRLIVGLVKIISVSKSLRDRASFTERERLETQDLRCDVVRIRIQSPTNALILFPLSSLPVTGAGGLLLWSLVSHPPRRAGRKEKMATFPPSITRHTSYSLSLVLTTSQWCRLRLTLEY